MLRTVTGRWDSKKDVFKGVLLFKNGERGKSEATLIRSIDSAERTLHVCMYAFTSQVFSKRSSPRNRETCACTSSLMVPSRIHKALQDAKVEVRIASGSGATHTKIVFVDKTSAAQGSLNWTGAAMTKNEVVCAFTANDMNAKLYLFVQELFGSTE